jgi:CheY-like chemotaxis protein
MSADTTKTTRDELTRWVHDALNKLYDSPNLQRNPLAEALAGPEITTHQRSQNLRRILLNAIRAIRPERGVPAQSPDWRAYRILELRYIDGLSTAEAMEQLAYGRSQFFREQARMLEQVVDVLWDKLQQIPTAPQFTPPFALDEPTRDDPDSYEQIAQSEIELLAAQTTWQKVALNPLIDQLHSVIDPLAHAKGITVSYHINHQIIVDHADRVFLRQVMLNTVAAALTVAGEKGISIGTIAGPRTHSIIVRAERMGTEGASMPQRLGLDVARGLMTAMHGTLVVTETPEAWEAKLLWPAATTFRLLLIDDNAGFADLFRRYLAQRPWQVIHAHDGTEGWQLIAETQPTVIMLDVMMPKEDGWEVLIALQAAAETRTIPVVICSVLNEPDMAVALGARGYLTKPVSQLDLLHALEPWER